MDAGRLHLVVAALFGAHLAGVACSSTASSSGSPVADGGSAGGTTGTDGSGGTTGIDGSAGGDGGPCAPGSTLACYTGSATTRDVGICRSGEQVCKADGTWGLCAGETLPQGEDCATTEVDEDCNGTPSCTCGDGVVQTDVAEECDGDPGCSPACRAGALDITAGDLFGCARLFEGVAKCWGEGGSGRLGLGDGSSRGDQTGEMGDALPNVDLGASFSGVQVRAGDAHVCALSASGSVKCWGAAASGQLGLGDGSNRGDQTGEMGDALPAVDLGTGVTATSVATSNSHSCAILSDASVKCWGYNVGGKLGLGDAADRGDQAGEMGDALPRVNLGTGKSATVIALGRHHSCASLNDGSLKCWGVNNEGALGLGDTVDRGDQAGEMGDALPVVDLGTGLTAVAIAAGGYSNTTTTGLTVRRGHTCAILNDGSVKCWGYGAQGRLGLGDTASRGDEAGEMGDALPAVDLGSGKTAVAISAGDHHTCAILKDGSVKCWGEAGNGRLGLGDTVDRGDDAGEMGDALPAVDLGAGRTALAIACGASHTCALLDDASVKCWGRNANGSLGLGAAGDRGDDANEMGDALPTVKLHSQTW